jgi:hypothetical protein
MSEENVEIGPFKGALARAAQTEALRTAFGTMALYRAERLGGAA